jgi:hypothetical protein
VEDWLLGGFIHSSAPEQLPRKHSLRNRRGVRHTSQPYYYEAPRSISVKALLTNGCEKAELYRYR